MTVHPHNRRLSNDNSQAPHKEAVVQSRHGFGRRDHSVYQSCGSTPAMAGVFSTPALAGIATGLCGTTVTAAAVTTAATGASRIAGRYWSRRCWMCSFGTCGCSQRVISVLGITDSAGPLDCAGAAAAAATGWAGLWALQGIHSSRHDLDHPGGGGPPGRRGSQNSHICNDGLRRTDPVIPETTKPTARRD